MVLDPSGPRAHPVPVCDLDERQLQYLEWKSAIAQIDDWNVPEADMLDPLADMEGLTFPPTVAGIAPHPFCGRTAHASRETKLIQGGRIPL